MKTPYENETTGDLFVGDSLVLPVLPGNYRVLQLKTVRNPIEGLSSTIVEIVPRKYVFEATIIDGREAIALVLTRLIETAEADPYNYSPIVVRDHVSPDFGAGEYSERRGVLSIEPMGGSIVSRDYGDYYSEGYKLTFSEV